MKVVINADDAGLHPAVRRGVDELVAHGVLTSISVVPTGSDVESAVKIQGVDIGVHLDILRGRPLSHWQHVNSIVDENGAFLGKPTTLFQLYAKGKVDHVHVEMEWAKQIERILDLGVKPTHLSSHRQVHAWPSLSRMAADLANKYGIRWVRKPEECSDISELEKSKDGKKFSKVCGMFTRETTDVNWTDVFWPKDRELDIFSVKAFTEYLAQTKLVDGDIVEICCRPGLTEAGDPPIPSFLNAPKIASMWESDYTSLLSEAWKDALQSLGLTVTNFSSLEDMR